MARRVERRQALLVAEELAGASSRSETNWWKRSGSPRPRSATCSRRASSVAKLAMSATGISMPSALLERSRVFASLASRKLRPSTASRAALTTPPNLVAIPPARISCATSPRESASRPASRASSYPGSPGAGSGVRSSSRRRLDHAADDVGRGRELPGRDAVAQSASNERGVEAEPLERVARPVIDVVGSSPLRASAVRERRRVRRAVDALLRHDRR